MTSIDTLSGLGLIGDYNQGAMSGLFSDIVGGIFGGGGKSKEKETIVKPAKPGGGGGVKPLTVGLVAGGALVAGLLLYGAFKR
jgi:hypothetical protein